MQHERPSFPLGAESPRLEGAWERWVSTVRWDLDRWNGLRSAGRRLHPLADVEETDDA